MLTVSILGSTGSVGCNTLDVLAQHPEQYRVFALAANKSVDKLAEQCCRWHPEIAILHTAEDAQNLERQLRNKGVATAVLHGAQALEQVAGDDGVDIVVGAIVGAAGLLSALAAARNGKKLLLANKESLVMSGQLLMRTARLNGAQIIPLDSEHNAIFQCLPVTDDGWRNTDPGSGVDKIVLTASGGPFRGYTKEQLGVVSRQQALEHPNWSMGPKISVDSATLMNKGLEVIEACYLFDFEPRCVDVVVHPESVVHSMVCYRDGSVLAQLGQPDMRTPIAHALAWPQRMASGVESLDLVAIGRLNFEAPDLDNFPCLGWAFEIIEKGGTAPTVFNAANEVAVEHFLEERVSFLQLSGIIEETLSQTNFETADDLDTILNADRNARLLAHTIASDLN